MPSGTDKAQSANQPVTRMVRQHDDHPDIGKVRSQQMSQLHSSATRSSID